MASINYGSLSFAEQIKFFRGKVNIPTRAWTDVYATEHDHGFMVAGAMRNDLLTDLRKAVDKVTAQGVTLEQFRKDFDTIVEQHGWSYNGGRNWRTRVIYDTNLRQSYNAGRREQMLAVSDTRPYWRYRHNDAVENPRPEHLAWDGLVLPFDDPFWQTHTPQNAWGCKCYVETLSKRDLKKLGKNSPDSAPPIEWEEKTIGTRGPSPRTVKVPKGIDPGFEYAPGVSRTQAMTPRPLPGNDLLPLIAGTSPRAKTLSPLPVRKAKSDQLLPPDLTDQEYVDKFLAEFMEPADRTIYFADVSGEYLLISDALFRDRSGTLKVGKRGRAQHLLLIADTIKTPDEIWQDWGEYGGKAVLRRRYVARWQVKGEAVPALGVFETGPQGWVGVTAFTADEVEYLEQRARRGERVWVLDK